MFRDITIPLGDDMRLWNHIFWSFYGKGHEMLQPTRFGGDKNNSPILELFITSEHNLGSKKQIKYQNNVRNVFRDTKLPSENIMGHCDENYQ